MNESMYVFTDGGGRRRHYRQLLLTNNVDYLAGCAHDMHQIRIICKWSLLKPSPSDQHSIPLWMHRPMYHQRYSGSGAAVVAFSRRGRRAYEGWFHGVVSLVVALMLLLNSDFM